MKLSWRQFHVYLDAFTWILQEETEDGRYKNAVADLEAKKLQPRIADWKKGELAKAKAVLARFEKRKVHGVDFSRVEQ